MILSNRLPLFLFDIDGTLLTVRREFSRPFIRKCLTEAGIASTGLDHATFAGRTDRDIFLSLVTGHSRTPVQGAGKDGSKRIRINRTLTEPAAQENGSSAAGNGYDTERHYEELKAIYIEQLTLELQAGHVEVFDGVHESIAYCIDNNIPIALLTGNYRETAFVKLNRAGLDHYFSHGSFGCDHTDRNMLAEQAVELTESWYGQRSDPSMMVVIGDTPRDIECARHAGLHAVAVSTGHYNSEVLARHNPDMLLDGLNNPENWIPACIRQIRTNP
jgi:phosphoglycolate phosphatase